MHSNNLSKTADILLECIWPFCEAGAYRAKVKKGGAFINFSGWLRKKSWVFLYFDDEKHSYFRKSNANLIAAFLENHVLKIV